MRLTNVAATLALTATLFLAACSHSAVAGLAASPVTMDACGTGQHARPGIISVVCATDYITARNLAWSGWGKPIATATGVAVVDLCAIEDCHTGSYNSVPIVLVASKIIRCPKGTRAYSRLQWVFIGGTPFPRLAQNENFSNFISGPMRPLLPVNQTVSFTC